MAGLTHGQAVLESLRRQNAALIDQDPVDVMVERTVWRDDGAGGRAAEETTLGPYRCRVFYRGQQYEERTTEAGAWREDEWGVTFSWDADIRAGDMEADVLVLPDGRRLRVRAVIPRTWAGERFAVHAICDLVR